MIKMEIKKLTDQQNIEHNIKLTKFKIIMDIILILILIMISVYVYFNIEEFKTLGNDVCKLCEKKADARCIAKDKFDSYIVFDKIKAADYVAGDINNKTQIENMLK